MRIGPITIRWTKDVKEEARVTNLHEMTWARRTICLKEEKALHTRMYIKLLAENVKIKAVLHRWGLDEGLVDRGASGKSKTPKAAGASL